MTIETTTSPATDPLPGRAGGRLRWSLAAVGGAIGGAVLLGAPASAHTGAHEHGLWSGLSHPVLGADHLVAMVLVGVLAVVCARPVLLPTTFVGSMLAGGALGLAGVGLPFVELLIVASVVALAVAILAARPGRSWTSSAVWMLPPLALAGMAHGYAHGAEAPAAGGAAWYVIGFVAATIALHATGVALGRRIDGHRLARTAVGAAGIGAGLVFAAGVI